MHCSEVLLVPLSKKKNSDVMVDVPDDFRQMLVERSAEPSVAGSTGASKGRCEHQESDGYVFKCGYSLGLGSLHRIQVDAAREAFKLSRGHNGALAMLAPWHASSNIDSAFRLRHHVDHDTGRRSVGGFRSQRSTETAGGAEAATGLCQ